MTQSKFKLISILTRTLLLLVIGNTLCHAALPLIVVQPMSQTIPAGAQATFSVVASGDGQLQYQWKKNGVDISGQTSASFTISSATAADAGDYNVVVSNTTGATPSSSARLTVGSLQLPLITLQPTNQSVNAGATVTFQVAASGSAPITFQWKRNGFNLSGQTSSSLTLQAVTTADAGNYSVDLSNAAGSTNSAVATLAVIVPNTPIIVVQPSSQTVQAGGQATFTVGATGSGQLSYQWKKDGNILSGQTGASLTINSVTNSDAGSYSVSVSNSAASTNSQSATLTVSTSIQPTITVSPVSQTVAAGGQVTFSVAATGSAPLTYQWSKLGSNLNGQTGSSLTLNNVSASDVGEYNVVVSNSSGQATASATLTITGEVVQAPSVIVNPVSQTVASGGSATFSVTATGSGSLQYQWKKNGQVLSGQTGASLTINAAASTDSGDYTVSISNSGGTVTSAAATLTITGSGAPSITLNPMGQSATVGGTVTFEAQAQGTAPLAFQWKKNGVSISGATSSSLVLTNVQASDAGNYQVFVSNANGAVASSQATLNVAAQSNVGSADNGFATGSISNVTAIAVQTDGKVILGGRFTRVANAVRNRIARLNADGSLDTTFGAGAGADGDVLAVKFLGNGKVLVAGSFTNLAGVVANRLGRLNADGTVDATFNAGAGANGSVSSMEVQTNGMIVIAGGFSQIGSLTRSSVARLNADGSVDATFNAGAGANNKINDIKVQADGKVIVGGNFSTMQGVASPGIARLNADGSLDASFGSGPLSGTDGTVNSVQLQSNGKILIGGAFTTVKGIRSPGVARLNADGSVDTSFSSGVTGLPSISVLRVQPDGNIVVCGNLSFAGIGLISDLCARLNVDGSLDIGLGAGLQSMGQANDIAVQADGNIVVASDTGVVRLVNNILRPRILASGKTSNSFSLSVQTRPGRNYVLESKANVDASTWNSLSTTAGDGSVKTMTDASATGSLRFYRIREE